MANPSGILAAPALPLAPRLGRRALLLALAFTLTLAACAGAPPPPPLPPLNPAPPALAGLRIHVRGATMDDTDPHGRSSSWISVWLCAAFQRALVRAGYRVVVDPKEPTDLVARLDADWQLSGSSVASLTLASPQAEVVEQLGALVATPQDAGEDLAGAVDLVNALGASPRLAAWVAARTRVVASP